MKAGFSILVPTWNNLSHLKLLIRSLRENSVADHQILIHVNEGADGTIKWLEAENIQFKHSKENIGICKAMNGLFALADREYIVYFNDDMYACWGWDVEMQKAIDQLSSNRFYLSCTMVEPRDTGNKCVVVFDAGTGVDDFDEHKLKEGSGNLIRPDWNGSSWPPSLMHRNLWEQIGGFSEEFSPGLYSDPDISMKLWQAGVRDFRGVGASLVYHFMQKSTGRVKLNDGKKQFLKKWGISASNFNRHVLKLGTVCTGPLPESSLNPSIKDRLKRLF